MLRSALVILVVFAAVAAGPLDAQRMAKPLPHWEPLLQSSAPAPKTPTPTPAPDYRWEGLAVGGLFVGMLGAALGNGLCAQDESGTQGSCFLPTVEGFVLGAVVGGVTGGLLGSAIPKSPPRPQ